MPREIAKAKALVDYHNIELDPATHTVFLKRAGMKLDLGAIGKGYAADQMLAVLQSQGIHHAMVVAGGEVVVGDPPPGASGWKVGIDTADADAGGPPCTVLLHAAAVSTSGDEHQFFVTEWSPLFARHQSQHGLGAGRGEQHHRHRPGLDHCGRAGHGVFLDARGGWNSRC